MQLNEIFKKIIPSNVHEEIKDKDFSYKWSFHGKNIHVEFIHLNPRVHTSIGLPNDKWINAYEVNFEINGNTSADDSVKLTKNDVVSNIEVLNQIFTKITDIFFNNKKIDVICFTPFKDETDFKTKAKEARDILTKLHKFVKRNNLPDDIIGNNFTEIAFYVHNLDTYMYTNKIDDPNMNNELNDIKDDVYSLDSRTTPRRAKIYDRAIKEYISGGCTVNKLNNGDVVIIKPNIINN